VKTVAQALGVSRSNLVDRLNGDTRARGRYRKADDADITTQVRRIVDRRPTYGYRRITGVLNKQRTLAGLVPVNHKRVYRIMAMQGWLLQRWTANRPGRVHDGKIIVMRSNLRWCSDAFEITCWNTEVVRVVFLIDAFDREIIGWDAVANQGVSGSMVRDLMLLAVEQRFGTLQAPQTVEFLSDNGSCYTALETRRFATGLNLRSCFTPVASPQSNGMAESFVKTIKRDYARINPLPDADTVLAALHRWFEDYNENHPHSGLKWRSPRDFIKAQS
jgi:transposase InsO family protein